MYDYTRDLWGRLIETELEESQWPSTDWRWKNPNGLLHTGELEDPVAVYSQRPKSLLQSSSASLCLKAEESVQGSWRNWSPILECNSNDQSSSQARKFFCVPLYSIQATSHPHPGQVFPARCVAYLPVSHRIASVLLIWSSVLTQGNILQLRLQYLFGWPIKIYLLLEKVYKIKWNVRMARFKNNICRLMDRKMFS